MNRIYKWFAQRDIRTTLQGRLRDISQPQEGRLTASDVETIVKHTWANFDILLPKAPKLSKYGNQYLLEYGVMSLALYRSLCSVVEDKAYATQLAADCVWRRYEIVLKLLSCLVEPIVRNREKRMEILLRILTRVGFGPPAFDMKTRFGGATSYLDYYRCPVSDYFREQGDEAHEFFRNSWCTYDWAAIEVIMNGPVKYERTHTLSLG